MALINGLSQGQRSASTPSTFVLCIVTPQIRTHYAADVSQEEGVLAREGLLVKKEVKPLSTPLIGTQALGTFFGWVDL